MAVNKPIGDNARREMGGPTPVPRVPMQQQQQKIEDE
jgi:hypothetical protein